MSLLLIAFAIFAELTILGHDILWNPRVYDGKSFRLVGSRIVFWFLFFILSYFILFGRDILASLVVAKIGFVFGGVFFRVTPWIQFLSTLVLLLVTLVIVVSGLQVTNDTMQLTMLVVVACMTILGYFVPLLLLAPFDKGKKKTVSTADKRKRDETL